MLVPAHVAKFHTVGVLMFLAAAPLAQAGVALPGSAPSVLEGHQATFTAARTDGKAGTWIYEYRALGSDDPWRPIHPQADGPDGDGKAVVLGWVIHVCQLA